MKGEGLIRKGGWTAEEDTLLKQCIQTFGEGNWHLLPTRARLNRCRKSCRFRWLNYLKPGINRRELQEDEVDMILRLHKLLGNKWSLIAGRLPGRTSNDIKNYWYTHIAKRQKSSKTAAKSSSTSSKGKQKLQDLVKVNAIRPIARRAPKIKFGISLLPPFSPQPDNLLHCNGIATKADDEMSNWLERLMDVDIGDFSGGGDGGCAASEGHWAAAAGGGYSYIDRGSMLDDLYIDDIFQL